MNTENIETKTAEPVSCKTWLDARGEPLQQGRVYKLSNSESLNTFECIRSEGTPNEEVFVRIGDGMKHRGREFIEFHNGTPYYAVESASNGALSNGEAAL